MGYETDFYGGLAFYPQISPLHRDYLAGFFNKNHYTISQEAYKQVAHYSDLHTLCGLPLDEHCTFYLPVESRPLLSDRPKYSNKVVANPTLPSAYCPLRITDTDILIRNGKSYDWEEWLTWVINNLLAPWNYTLAGEIEWSGEEPDDRGKIVATAGQWPTIYRAEIAYKAVRSLGTCA